MCIMGEINQITQLIAEFKEQVYKWKNIYEELLLQDLKELYNSKIEVKQAIVFNNALLSIDPKKIKYILVGDNPGKNEQKEGIYLCGRAGERARNFFEKELVNNFNEEVLVLNKSPIFTMRTRDIKELSEHGEFMKESQRYMADLVFNLHSVNKNMEVFISGFAGCRCSKDGKWLKQRKNNGGYYKSQILPYFFAQLKNNYTNSEMEVKIYKHFSNSHFSKDIKKYNKRDSEIRCVLNNIGSKYFRELMGDINYHSNSSV